ncbi:hypothetical protein TMatcc_010199 [Talaromyces marneffei ATCC 18224]|uniref:BZIP domain-containing protein n=2 Tax=Talaromyces marneffei TaxID=37727 RepID=B6QWB7_TALMQ|nr:uncharacterized protein EYB26_009992 [Talaromyces marneffei]EEA19245.1 conserved hypothetical protein [Talaromyces marneffei ATCC 18224]KAE8548935.1 hypothetical protein EYB25_009318 [Talaromyces marneffei]QGA22276.1 hypothetical protein EYB26_009992 [Talaromyces marneffei]
MTVQLQVMPQLAEALNDQDDWTGLTDAVSRRKRQNRLNIRAYRRRRKALEVGEKQEALSMAKSSPVKIEGPAIPCWDEDLQTVISLPASEVDSRMGILCKPLLLLLADGKTVTPTRQTPHKVIFPLCPDHLILLLQYNVLRATLINIKILSPLLTITSCSADTLNVLPKPSLPDQIPPTLWPTKLQQTIPHEDWVDIIPHPRWRDNVLLALGTFDEDELWSDTIGGLFEGFPQSEIERRGVIVWSPPWDICGWEITEGFWKKWGFLMKGCEDILDVTNYWRRQRGEEPLVFEV